MRYRLEHANICVRNVDSMIRFLQTVFPDFQVRKDVTNDDGTRWVHVGTNETYIALNLSQLDPAEAWEPYGGKPGVNHLAYEVDDAEGVRERMLTAGFEESTPPNAHPHRCRVYFYDPEGNDWEFVQYFTDDPALKHDYDLPG